MKATPAPRPLSSPSVRWLLASLAAVTAPHAARLPLWISVLAGATLLARYFIAERGFRLPSRPLLLALALTTSAGVFFQYGTLFGRDAGVALLVVMLALKLLELRSGRDAALLIFMAYFLVVTNFFFSQTIATALYMLLVVWVITAAMIGVQHSSGHIRARQTLALAARLLAESLPLMLVFFVLFPRVQGPLWGLPSDALAGSSGLSDTMAPGSLSNLSLSDAVAFRAQFQTVPRKTALYWRGPVLWDFDGRTWSAHRSPDLRAPSVVATGQPVEYAVTLEATSQRWLFALDLPIKAPSGSRITGDFQVLAVGPVRSRMRYQAASALDYRLDAGDLDAATRQRATALPLGFNPRTQALAQSLRRQAGDDAGVVRAALALFRNQPFVYTLAPPLLGENSVDEFLFDTRRGFCEHFSSSFTVLMRAAGVPARVVTGYQGGEINPVDNYLMVRQADAHAWAEVWLPMGGWVRIDPTAAVSPLRVEAGMAAAVPSGDPVPFFARGDYPWLKDVRFAFDAVANSWNQWVLGYGPERQKQFLSHAGLDASAWKHLAIALFSGAGLIVLILAALVLRGFRPTAFDPAARAYAGFCRTLARRGIPRRPVEGPLDYAARVGRSRPDLAANVGEITALYVGLRYGKASSDAALRELRGRVRRFRG